MTTKKTQFVEELPYLSVLKTHNLTTNVIELTEKIFCQDRPVEDTWNDENETPDQKDEPKKENDSKNANNNNTAMYYIDSINDFPTNLLMKRIPLTEENEERVYRRLSVLKVFDLDDLLMNVMKTIQFVKSSNFNVAAAEAEAEAGDVNITKKQNNINQIVILINGIDVLWDSYSMHGLKQAKRKLNEIMVRIRSFRNLSPQCTIKTIFTFESIKNDNDQAGVLPLRSTHGLSDLVNKENTNIMKTVPVGPNSNKKRNIFVLSNYLLNFYADASL